MLFVTFLLENFLPDPVRCATSLPEAEIHDCRAKYPNWEEKSCGVSAIGCVSKSLQKSCLTYDDSEAKARCDGLEVMLLCAGQTIDSASLGPLGKKRCGMICNFDKFGFSGPRRGVALEHPLPFLCLFRCMRAVNSIAINTRQNSQLHIFCDRLTWTHLQ